jgi:hypothetical protein
MKPLLHFRLRALGWSLVAALLCASAAFALIARTTPAVKVPPLDETCRCSTPANPAPGTPVASISPSTHKENT